MSEQVPEDRDFDNIEDWLLKNFPGDLKQYYNSRVKNLERSRTPQKRFALEILSWLHYSHGIAALTVRQLSEALDVGNPEPAELTKTQIQNACQGLVRVRYDFVQFVSTEFNTYLSKEPPDGLLSPMQLAMTCLNSLAFRPPCSSSKDTLSSSVSESFQDHAAKFWANYAEQAIRSASTGLEFRKFILEHLMWPRKRDYLIEILQCAEQYSHEMRQIGFPPLHIAGEQTLLHILIRGGLISLVLEILANPQKFLSLLETPESSQDQVLQDLADIHSKDACGQTLLHYAAMSTRPEAADLASELMKQGAEVEAETTDGSTAMHISAYSGNTNIMSVLFEEHASVSAVDNRGWTPAHIAASKGNLAALKFLVENGAKLSAEDNDGYNVLHYAIDDGQIPVIEYILDQNPELLNAGPMSPLHRAVSQCQVEPIRILMRYGADVMSKAKIMLYALPDVTPLEVSIKSGQAGPAEELVSYGAYLRIYKNFLVTKARWANLNGNGRLATNIAVNEGPISKVSPKDWDNVNMDGQPLTISQLERLRETAPHHPVPKLLLSKKHAEEGAHRFYTAQHLYESAVQLDQIMSDGDHEESPALCQIAHRGVRCNICGMHPVRGLRYKCVFCPPFDICHDCWKAEGHRMDHPLLVLPSLDWLKQHGFNTIGEIS